MLCVMFVLDIVFIVNFIKFSSGPSPVCKKLKLVIDNKINYKVMLGFNKSFLKLVIFLICLKNVVMIFNCAATVTARRCPRV